MPIYSTNKYQITKFTTIRPYMQFIQKRVSLKEYLRHHHIHTLKRKWWQFEIWWFVQKYILRDMIWNRSLIKDPVEFYRLDLSFSSPSTYFNPNLTSSSNAPVLVAICFSSWCCTGILCTIHFIRQNIHGLYGNSTGDFR